MLSLGQSRLRSNLPAATQPARLERIGREFPQPGPQSGFPLLLLCVVQSSKFAFHEATLMGGARADVKSTTRLFNSFRSPLTFLH